MTKLEQAAKNALANFEWNMNTDLDNIRDCTEWVSRCQKSIADLLEALDPKQWVSLDKREMLRIIDSQEACKKSGLPMFYRDQCMNMLQLFERALKEKNS